MCWVIGRLWWNWCTIAKLRSFARFQHAQDGNVSGSANDKLWISFFASDEESGAKGRMQRAQDGVFEGAERAQGAVDEGWRDGRVGGLHAENFFDGAFSEFYREGPLKPVGGVFDF